MKITDVPMFGVMRQRLDWLNQRQQVLTQNIANADTPEYRARDLKKLDFETALRNSRPGQHQVNLKVTSANHIANRGGASGPFKEVDNRRPYETAPDGNQVVLEEQMVNMDATTTNHNLITQIYRKHHLMFKSVLRGGR